MNFIAVLISVIGLTVLHCSQLSGVGAYDAIEFENFNSSAGVETEVGCPHDEVNTTYIKVLGTTANLGFLGISFADRALGIEIKLSDDNLYGHTGVISVRLDSATGPVLTTVNTGVTGSVCNFADITTYFTLIPSGDHDVYFTFTSPSNDYIVNLDSFTFINNGTDTATTTATGLAAATPSA